MSENLAFVSQYTLSKDIKSYEKWAIIMFPTVRKGAISVASVRSSVCLFVYPSVAYIANNLRTQRPSVGSVPKFGMKVPHLRCYLHTSFKVKRSMVRVTDRRGHTMSAKSGGRTACWLLLLLAIIITDMSKSEGCLSSIL